MHDALAAYNAVKRVRRLLKVELSRERTDSSPTQIYELILELNDEQLKFERLKVLARLVNDKRVPRVFGFVGIATAVKTRRRLWRCSRRLRRA